MPSDVEQALWGFEEAVEKVLSFVKASAYGLRLATRRVADSAAVPLRAAAKNPSSELDLLVDALEQAEDHLSDVVVLAFGDHLRAFLARALELPALPNLPASPAALEELTGTPGALSKSSPWLALLLQLYRVTLRGAGALDREALQVLGRKELEIPFPGGKVKLFRAGDRLTLSEQQLEEAGQALVEAARSIYLRLVTA